jgi:hypothetical protein
MALARWAKLADPGFDFDDAFKRFTDGINIDTGRTDSIRGSRCGELVARCRRTAQLLLHPDGSRRTVLKEVCATSPPTSSATPAVISISRTTWRGRWARWRFSRAVAHHRAEDDELAYAYYAANHGNETYVRKRFVKAYIRRAFACYRREHLERAIGMALKAVGLKPNGLLNRAITSVATNWLRLRIARLARAGA